MEESRKSHVSAIAGIIFRRYSVGIVLVILFIIGSIATPNFLKVKNITNVLRQISVTGVLALAESILIICGQIDLSLGSVLAMSGIISVDIYLASGSLLVGIIAAAVIAGITLAISGIFVAKVHLIAFITTMAMDYVARGITFIYTGGQSKYEIGNFSVISTTYIGAIPVPVIVLFTCAIICAFIMNKTTLGRNIFAVGGNKEAANAAGINVSRTIVEAFLVAGILTGVAAVLQMARVNSAIPSTAEGYHGDAIAAAIIGGTSFSGGIGTVGGVLIGSAIMGFLSNLLNLLGFSSYFQQVTKGVIIVGALTFDNIAKNRKVHKRLRK